MLEILLLIYLCKQLGNKLRDKGRSPGWWQFLLVVLWFVGEFVGAVVGMGIFDAAGGAYLFALLGAAAGAIVVFIIARNLRTPYESQRGFSVITSGDDRSR